MKNMQCWNINLQQLLKCTILIIAVSLVINPKIFAQSCATPLSNNALTSPGSVCSGSIPGNIVGSLPSGADGNYSYSWESSTTSATTNFTTISGATSQSYAFSTGLTVTTWYRRVVTACSTSSTSLAIQIAVNPQISGNTIGGTSPQNVCITSTPATIAGSTPAGGSGTLTYLWESSTTSASAGFTSATGTNNLSTYSFIGPLTQTTWFRRVVQSTNCNSSTSNVFQYVVTPAITNNIISQAQSICSGQTPLTLTGATLSGGSGGYTYAWESSTTSATSGFTSAPGTNNTASYSPIALTQNTWFRRTVTSGGCSNTSAAILVTVNSAAQGDQTVFGSAVWNVYAFSDASFGSYSGYYVDANANFNSTTNWAVGLSPSMAPGYSGCQVPNDNHSVIVKRQGFTPGTYQINIPSHDDNVYLYINGTQVFSHIGCCDVHTNVWTGYLNGTSTIEFRWSEGVGSSFGSIDLVSIATPTLSAGTIGYDQQICPGNDPVAFTNVASATGSCSSITYQWQVQAGCSGAWTDISGATSSTYDIPSGLASTNCYRRVAKDACLNSVNSNTAQVTVNATPPGDPTVYGNNVWNAYAFTDNNFTNYAGYYIENNLSFNSSNRWLNTSAPSTASIQNGVGFLGCQSVPTDAFSVSYKRKGFPAATYQVDIPYHDDNVYLYINGTLIFTHAAWGDSHTNVWTGPLDSNSTIELRFLDVSGPCVAGLAFTSIPTPTSIDPGIVGYDQEICSGDNPAAFDNAASASGGCYASYQWQYQTNCTGVWNDIAGATSAIYDVPAGLTQSTCYRRVASDVCGNTATSSIITVTVSTPTGTPSVFGNGVWNFYTYNGNFATYAGYYSDASLNFNTTTRWGQSLNPSVASGYQGCQVGNDNFSFAAKRQNFTPGTYQIDIPTHDDNVSLYVNGTLVYTHVGCCDAHTAVWTGPLNASSTVEYRIVEGGGSSSGSINFTTVTPTPLLAGTIGSDQIICPGDDPVLFTNISSASGGCYPTYQWQYQAGCTGAWVDISGATAATYDSPTALSANGCFRRVVNDLCGNTAVSNTITVAMGSSLGDPTVYGNGQWNIYTYNGSFGTYLGYYIESSLTFNTNTQWGVALSPSSAPSWQGCHVPVNNFSASFKRTNFTPGTYQIDVTAQDDNGTLFINGVQVYNAGCCNAVNNIWTGSLQKQC